MRIGQASGEARQSVVEGCSEQGAVMVEAAMSIFVFLWMLFSSIEAALFVFDVNTLHYSLDRVARNCLIKSTSTHTWVESEVMASLAELGIVTGPVDGAHIQVCEGFHSDCATESTGAPGGFFTITVTYNRSLMSLPFTYPVSASVTVRNETFGTY